MKNISFPISFMAVVLAAVMLCSCGRDDTVPQAGDLNDKPIVILYDNDVHCSVDGYSAIAGLRDRLEASGTAYVALVSCGDFLQGGSMGVLSRGEFIVDIMNAAGYDVVTIGNHEFDYGYERLKGMTDRLKAGVTCANYVRCADGSPVYAPYIIKQMGRKKVAFIGVVTPSAIYSESYAFYDNSHRQLFDLMDDQLNSLIQDSVDAARREGADYVILLSHLGPERDSCKSNSLTVIAGTTGIDAVLDGHTHTVMYEKWYENAGGKQVLLTQTGSNFKNIGQLTITNEGRIYSVCTPLSYIPDESSKVKAEIDRCKAECDELMDGVLSYSTFPIGIFSDSGVRISRNAECSLGDLAADALRDATGADIGLMNGGGISGSLPSGKITWRNVYDIFPFGNTVVTVLATGQQIIDHLEICSVYCPNENGSFMQVSGLSYKVNTSFRNKIYVNSSTGEIRVEGGRRVSLVKVEDEDGNMVAIDPQKQYLVATINYVVDSAQTFPVLAVCERVSEDIMTDSECVGYYLQSFEGEVPRIYGAPQGRIGIIK
ncbi:MAG: bifunctional metallophosphatase/5'-nucleotidase [Bacteroidales bacterium]|nr:bifunctional metallophosphatase/5'-nucleotidase [Bacteroidales bacterium]